MEFFTVSDECLKLGLRAGAIVLRNVRISDADYHRRHLYHIPEKFSGIIIGGKVFE